MVRKGVLLMNGNRGRYAFAPLNNMKNKRPVQGAAPAVQGNAAPRKTGEVRRSSALTIVVTLVLPILFLLALFIPDTALRLVFLAVAAISICAMWVMNVFLRDARSTLTVAYVALMVVIAVALILGGQNPESGNARPSARAAAAPVQDWTSPHYNPTNTVTSTPAAYVIEETSTSQAQKQLEHFLEKWRENEIPSMLTLSAPSWVAKQQSPETALWNVMCNRDPIEYKIERVEGSEADTSRTITVKVTFENLGTGDITVERLHVLMFRVNDTWYVDPQSLNGTRVDEAAEAARAEQGNQRIQSTKVPITPTPKPTGDAAMQVYYNPDGGRYYHGKPNCPEVSESYWPLSPFYYGDLETQKFEALMQCPACNAPPRK